MTTAEWFANADNRAAFKATNHVETCEEHGTALDANGYCDDCTERSSAVLVADVDARFDVIELRRMAALAQMCGGSGADTLSRAADLLARLDAMRNICERCGTAIHGGANALGDDDRYCQTCTERSSAVLVADVYARFDAMVASSRASKARKVVGSDHERAERIRMLADR